MKRGDIYFANLNPTVGSEIRKKRPVLVISSDDSNYYAATVTGIPLTSNTKKVYPFEVLLDMSETGLSKPSKAQCHQIRSLSKLRFEKNRAGHISDLVMQRIMRALCLHLDIRF